MNHRNGHKHSKSTKKAVWQKIATKMNSAGYSKLNWASCDKKFRNLKVTYRSILDNNKKSGRDRKKWTYFDLLHDIFAGEPATVPTGVEVGAECSSTLTSVVGEDMSAAQTCHEQSAETDKKSPAGKVRTPKKSSRKRKNEAPTWFLQHMEESKKANEEAKLHLLEQIHNSQKQQAAEKMELLRGLNDNIAKLVEKL